MLVIFRFLCVCLFRCYLLCVLSC